MDFKNKVTEQFKLIQDDICNQLEVFDGVGLFHEDKWERPKGGGGRTRIMTDGRVIEKGGVNFSAVHGILPDNIAQALKLTSSRFYATGVSIVLHPGNPHVPIIHMNIRYFETHPLDGGEAVTWWFGGGIDLTPHYVIPDDARYFHRALKKVCDAHHPDFYGEFKKWADDYFYLQHRQETRGIGGIFFDRIDQSRGMSADQLKNFVDDVGHLFGPLYIEMASKHAKKEFTPEEKEWQLIRRGRYVEFNLVYDKGTKFGLDTGGRIESILMSLPLTANWYYNHQPIEGTKEAATLEYLKKGMDWA